jgi:hypothetical protein
MSDARLEILGTAKYRPNITRSGVIGKTAEGSPIYTTGNPFFKKQYTILAQTKLEVNYLFLAGMKPFSK